jgi:hypothetical protein
MAKRSNSAGRKTTAAKPLKRAAVRNTAIPKAAPAKAQPSSFKAQPFKAQPTGTPAQPQGKARRAVTFEMIAQRAYEIWQSGTGGSDFDNWCRAERELRGN